MTKSYLYLLILVFAFSKSSAQLIENFSDGDFTNNPTWSGNTTDFLVNSSLQLQSNNTVVGSSYYLSTTSTLATVAQWEMYINLGFNTSSVNYVDVYLTASNGDLMNGGTTGYFVRLGGTNDEICLYRNDGGGTVKLIDGVDDVLNSSNNTIKLKVVRNALDQWNLMRDMSGTGTSYVSEGTVLDGTYNTSSFFGFVVKQSTGSFFQKHFIDDIQIQAYSPDVTPPSIVSATALSPTSVDVVYSESVDQATAEVASNYFADNGIGNPLSAQRDVSNTALVHLVFANNFPNGATNNLTVNNVNDLSGNTLLNGTSTFSFYFPQTYDVVIDEIFADPSPIIGLPNAEFIEVKNRTNKNLNLLGWVLKSSSSTSAPFPSYILPPGGYLILTGTSDVASFSPFGPTIGITSFPALLNDGTTLSLTSKEGITIHSVSYNVSWFKNAVKSNGGWTLEMIDTQSPCTGADNWKASEDAKGGTPGVVNSVNGSNPDQTPPALVRAAAFDNTTLVLTFSEAIDSAKGANIANYSISNGIVPISAYTIAPAFNKVVVTLSTPLQLQTLYTIVASNIADCSGNTIQSATPVRFGLPSPADTFDVVINEILFNPKPTSVDYIEIYNRSSKIFDLKDLYIANRDAISGNVNTISQLTTESLLLFPGEFYVISENNSLVKSAYVAKNPDNFVDVSMPSFPDDKGDVVILNASGKVIDELKYDAKWHFSLIDNDEGISLERIDYSKPTQNASNWYSAASTAGFGTPSYQNSQFRMDVSVKAEITIVPKIFSPDQDGTDDFATIQYQLTEPGFVANITIFDASGRPVRYLAKNATLALSGSFRWDGLNDKLGKIPVGNYIVYTEIFNLNGKKKAFKNSVTVARRF